MPHYKYGSRLPPDLLTSSLPPGMSWLPPPPLNEWPTKERTGAYAPYREREKGHQSHVRAPTTTFAPRALTAVFTWGALAATSMDAEEKEPIVERERRREQP